MRTIYLDMDGVAANFNVYVEPLLGRKLGWEDTADITDGEWAWLSENEPHLFAKLPLCDGMEKFYFHLQEIYIIPKLFTVEWLTAIPRAYTFKYATQDKIIWARTHIPGPKVCIGPYSRDKVQQARIGDVLIDDRLDNLKAWAGKGGQGIYHPTNGDFGNTVIAMADCARTTLPGIWKAGKREAIKP